MCVCVLAQLFSVAMVLVAKTVVVTDWESWSYSEFSWGSLHILMRLPQKQ